MKKIIALLLISLLIVLSSCFQSETEVKEQIETTQTEETIIEADADSTINEVLTDEELTTELNSIFDIK